MKKKTTFNFTNSEQVFKGWNEFNTLSKLIIPYLNDALGYPDRRSEFFDEQTWVRKKGLGKGPYDGAFKNDSGVIVLVEAKRQDTKPLSKKAIDQLFSYCLGEDFPIPPPYAFASNGHDHRWFRRLRNELGDYTYVACEPVLWKRAIQEKGSGELTEQLTLVQTIRLFKKVRNLIFEDLSENFFSNGYSLSENNLSGRFLESFQLVLKTRKSYVDPGLENANDETVIRSILSSIALSLTLKMLFLKIRTDQTDISFPKQIISTIEELSDSFPGILKAKPYDALEFSRICEQKIVELLKGVHITQALIFEERDNPIGEIWDHLIESEELDLQVKSLGNVYTPQVIVKAMTDRAEKTLGGWKNKKVLEPACGSGHFVREMYGRMRDSFLGNHGNEDKIVEAHEKTMSNIRAIDIDPFAVQTTQLGMFLELYRTPGLWKRIAPNDVFDFSKVVKQGDYLDQGLFSIDDSFSPDLIIGNPPYGVAVTDQTATLYGLDNNDSYGCFIVKAIKNLPQSGHILFIVSSTFLTTRTHRRLREIIFNETQIRSVYVLHRNAFPRDVFCCLFEIQKNALENNSNHYTYVDAWPIKPKDPDYKIALTTWSQHTTSDIPRDKCAYYEIPQNLLHLRIMPPNVALPVEKELKLVALSRALLKKNEKVLPIIGGLPSLFLFCSDTPYENRIREKTIDFPKIGPVEALEIKREQGWVPIVKLWQLASVKQGLATADDKFFLRKSPGVNPNARRKYIRDVDLHCTIPPDKLHLLTEGEKINGISVIDPQRDKYFVPFDKGGEQDTAGGELRSFWSPVDYWIDWSEKSVSELKRRNEWEAGTPKKPRFQNSQYYFKKGIRFSRAGLYAPMFEMSFGGVFSDKGSLILSFNEQLNSYLLAILCSQFTRYLIKNFLQSSVMTETDIIKQIPIVIPTVDEMNTIHKQVSNILDAKKNKSHNNEEELNELERKVNRLYQLPLEDQKEIEIWFKRRYPNFGRNAEPKSM